MLDLFLKVDGIAKREDALAWSINAAVQRNHVYKTEEDYERRAIFREVWMRLLELESQPYLKPERAISDVHHCEAIGRIADKLSADFNDILQGGRLRFGTSQKAFNLYLKYLWALGEAAMPPHCPVDSVILSAIGSTDSWTKSDSCDEYMSWINAIRKRLELSVWENECWLRWRLSNANTAV